MKKLYPLLSVLFLIYWDCVPPTKSIQIKVDQNIFSGKEVVIVDVFDGYLKERKNLSDPIDNDFSYMGNGNSIKYNSLKNRTGVIEGSFDQVLNNVGKTFLVIKMDDGRRIKYRYPWIERPIKKLPTLMILKEDIEKVKTMVGKNIWLNKTKVLSYNFFGEDNISFFTDTPNLFNSFDEVLVVDVYSLSYGSVGINKPIWLKVKSKNGGIGNVLYNNEIEDNFYYEKYPFHSNWDEEIIQSIKNGSVIIGMSEEQVYMSLGEPSDVNTTTTKSSISKQIVYNKSGKKPLYIYLENDKVETIQN